MRGDGVVSSVVLCGVLVGAGVLAALWWSEPSEEAGRARAVRAANAWMRYSEEEVRAVACHPEGEEGTACVVVRSSGLVVTLRCDSGSTWECSPAIGARP